MVRPTHPQPDDPDQSKRFLELAKEIGADDDKALEASVKRLAAQPRAQRREVRKKVRKKR